MNHPFRVSAAGIAFAAAFLCFTPVRAGSPLFLNQPGQPLVWPDGGRDIPFNPDLGGFGPFSNAEAVAQTVEAFERWAAIPSATATYRNAGSLPFDVDETNFFPFLFPEAPDGLSPIVFDEDGAIFEILFGVDSGVLGLASPEWVNPATGEIREGSAFFNGGILGQGFPVAGSLTILVHEFGHYSNLGHSVVNGEIALFQDNTGPTPYDTFPLDFLAGRIETMYPFYLSNGGADVPHADDIAIFSTLYPAPDFFATRGSIRGTLFAQDGATPVTGINVIARNLADPFGDPVSSISGDFSTSFPQADPFTGTYTLNGLTPGAEYAVFVDQILAGVFVTPVLTLPGPEEFYNGDAESVDPDLDDPSMFTPVPVEAGVPMDGIDITFNILRPGPIPLGDDTFVQLFLPFPFRFCGHEHFSLFVNSNGTLTFGAGDLGFIESGPLLLAGPPRIAPLWDDLNPLEGGEVSFRQTKNKFTVSFSEVPEFPRRGANSFEVTLHRASNQVEFSYENVGAPDGLAGISCGGALTSGLEPEVDLSAATLGGEKTLNANNRPGMFEWFTGNDNDLDHLAMKINAPNSFLDHGEPNDSIVQATRVSLPFDGAERFTAIDPGGGDIDFFRFFAEEGRILLAEARQGNHLDTIIGVFDVRTGELLAFDDDSGPGPFARLVFPIPADGRYAVAVTTFPDFDFLGEGNSGGRYILDMKTFDGDILPLGDDDTLEIQFENFEFPFQGQNWTGVFVNSNGSLTFGEGDVDFTESIRDFRNGPPRIAPLWTDLSPNAAGTIDFERRSDALIIRFTEVPEFPDTGANTFSVTLEAGGGIVTDYGETNRPSCLVGVTGGGGVPNPGQTDLSEATDLPATGTTFERFLSGEFDLDFSTLIWTVP
jgi:hypothetical protein